MGDSLCLDMERYGDTESQAIAQLGAQKDQLGAAFAFMRNRRSLADFRELPPCG
jgi:hypothetical protein